MRIMVLPDGDATHRMPGVGRAVLAVLVTLLLLGCGTPDARRPPEEPTAVHRLQLSHGETDEQVVDLQWPEETGPFPVVVLVHGGFWRQQYGKDLMVPLARDAVMRGYATANVEYRRVGGAGGWPATFVDLAAAIDVLADADAPLDLGRVVVVGHSAGGQLAAWGVSRPALPPDAIGAGPAVRPCAAVSLAGVVDLATAAREAVGDTAVPDLMGGGPDEVPERYMVGDPAALAPPPVPVLLVHARDDDRVPLSQSVAYAEVAGEAAQLSVVDGDHFTVIDPADASWDLAMDWIESRCR